MLEIPPQLRYDNFRFILVAPKNKRPIENYWNCSTLEDARTKWKDERDEALKKNKEFKKSEPTRITNYKHDDPLLLDHLKKRGNYGVLCGSGGLIVVDADRGELQKEVVESLPKTLTIQTGRGGTHSYFISSDIKEKIVLQSDFHYGEIQANGAQVVGPGSIHENGNQYKIIQDEPIATITLNELLPIIEKFKAVEKKDIVKEVKNEVNELEEILKDPDLFRKITEDEFNKKVVGEVDNRKAIFLMACGSLVENHNIASYNLCIDSSSGAGKDYVMDTVVKYFPEVSDKDTARRGYVKRTRISPTVFNYWHTAEKESLWTWDGKICYLPDISENVINHEVFKVMCSEGSKATITVNNEAREVTINGKPVMFVTTAATNPNNENLRRWPRISLDESPEQTRAIINTKARFAATGKTADYDEKSRKAITFLKRVKVKVPFAEAITNHLPDEHIIMRTNADRFFDLVKASAAFHQKQRQKDEEGFILAEAPQDYEIARLVLNQTNTNSLMIPLTKKQKDLIAIIKEKAEIFEGRWFRVRDLEPHISFLSEKALYTSLDKLRDLGFLDLERRDHEESKKPVRFYRLKSIEAHKLPGWGDISSPSCGKTTINTLDTLATIDTINTIDASQSNNCNNCNIFPLFSAQFSPDKEGVVSGR